MLRAALNDATRRDDVAENKQALMLRRLTGSGNNPALPRFRSPEYNPVVGWVILASDVSQITYRTIRDYNAIARGNDKLW